MNFMFYLRSQKASPKQARSENTQTKLTMLELPFDNIFMEFRKNSARIPQEFRKNSVRILEFCKNSRIPIKTW